MIAKKRTKKKKNEERTNGVRFKDNQKKGIRRANKSEQIIKGTENQNRQHMKTLMTLQAVSWVKTVKNYRKNTRSMQQDGVMSQTTQNAD